MDYNKLTDSLITGSVWHIDKEFGINALNKYLHDLTLLSSGQVTLKDLYQDSANKSGYDIKNGTAIIKLDGVMRVQDGLCSKGITEQVRQIENANQDISVQDILIYANTGGGESQAGTILHNAIKDSKKNVYVLGEMIASAGYNASLSAKKIFLSSTLSQAGSIGTMVTLDKTQLDTYRKNYQELYSSISTEKNKAWRDLLEGNSQTIINEITDNAQKFVDKVKEFRGGVAEHVLTGGMLYGQSAVDHGLIDGIKTMSETLQFIQEQRTSNNNINLKNTNMNFQEKLTSVLHAINTFFGWEVKDEAELATSLTSVGETFEAFKSNLRIEISNEATQKLTEALQANTNLIQQMQTQIEGFEARIAEMTSSIETINAENATLKEQNSELTVSLMDLKGKAVDKNNSNNSMSKAERSFVDQFGNAVISMNKTN